jgi:hypothetical protein
VKNQALVALVVKSVSVLICIHSQPKIFRIPCQTVEENLNFT